MKLRIAFTRPAKLDLDELIGHIGEENPRAAVNVAGRILDRIRLLAANAPCPALRDAFEAAS